MFEQQTHGLYPWAQQNETTGRIKRYGLCPECNNAMLLINIDNPDPIQNPHGRHRLKPVPSFAYCHEEILNCDLFTGDARTEAEDTLRQLTPEGIELRQFIADHINIAIGVLQEDIGIVIEAKLAASILRTYFADRWYLWPDATLGNLPWLFLRTTFSYPLYGHILREGSETCSNILSQVPEACLGPYHRLQARPGQRINLRFGISGHTVRESRTGKRRETVTFFVVEPGPYETRSHRIVFEKHIELRPEVFLKRVNEYVPTGPSSPEVVKLAHQELQRHLA